MSKVSGGKFAAWSKAHAQQKAAFAATPSTQKFKPTPLPSLLVGGGPSVRVFHQGRKPRSFEVYAPSHPAAKARNGWVALHRVVLENERKSYLSSSDRVLFVDGNGFNFSPGNLVVGGESRG